VRPKGEVGETSIYREERDQLRPIPRSRDPSRTRPEAKKVKDPRDNGIGGEGQVYARAEGDKVRKNDRSENGQKENYGNSTKMCRDTSLFEDQVVMIEKFNRGQSNAG